MAKITRSLSRRVTSGGTSEIHLRVSLSRTVQLRVKSKYYVKPQRFKDGEIILPRANQKEREDLQRLDLNIKHLESEILDFCVSRDPSTITKDMIQKIVDRHHVPKDESKDHKAMFFDIFNRFLRTRNFSHSHTVNYQSLMRALYRYEKHRQATQESRYKLNIDTFNAEDLSAFQSFLLNEYQLYAEYPESYIDYPQELACKTKRMPKRRGENSIHTLFSMLQAVFLWCNKEGITDNRPFDKYEMPKSRYGTPFFLTVDERNHLAEFDFSDNPGLARYRDTFILQCLVGCRASDLNALKKSNIVNGVLEYVPRKTSHINVESIRIPLNQRAADIIKKYADIPDRLLPAFTISNYNIAIKVMLRRAGIDRMVTVFNSTSGHDERHPIWEVASSHMARRTFIGNLYKHVKDQILVSSLSGHRNGSQAFKRYEAVDDEMKRDLIDLIE